MCTETLVAETLMLLNRMNLGAAVTASCWGAPNFAPRSASCQAILL